MTEERLSITRCAATAPDLWTVGCQLDLGHDGAHRNNQTIWNDDQQPDLDRETEHWQGGRVRFSWEST